MRMIVCLFFGFLLYSCQVQEYPVIIDLEVSQYDKNAEKLSELLQHNYKEVSKHKFIDYTEDHIIVLDTIQCVLAIFDKDRNFIKVIAKRGDDWQNGDFNTYFTHIVDTETNEIFLLSWYRINKYDFNGKLLEEINLSGDTFTQSGLPDDISFTDNGNILLHITNIDNRAEYDYVIIDRKGKCLGTHPAYTIQSSNITLKSPFRYGMGSYVFEGMLHVKDFGDTLFVVSEKALKPKYIFNYTSSLFKKRMLKYEDLCNALGHSIIVEEGRYLTFDAFNNRDYYVGRYDKKRKKGVLYPSTDIRKEIHSDYLSLIEKIPTQKRDDNSVSSRNTKPADYYIENINGHKIKMIHLYDNKYIAEVETTQRLWRAVTGNYHSSYDNNPNHPVSRVTYYTANDFTALLSKLTGHKYRLPTVSEWEYAANSGLKEGMRWSGTNNEEELFKYANFRDSLKTGMLPVKSKLPNKLGIYDLSGNAQEWCSDWYSEGPHSQKDNLGPLYGAFKTLKGGHYADLTQKAENHVTKDLPPSHAFAYIGFRLLLEL